MRVATVCDNNNNIRSTTSDTLFNWSHVHSSKSKTLRSYISGCRGWNEHGSVVKDKEFDEDHARTPSRTLARLPQIIGQLQTICGLYKRS